jgi:hypothetical protein
MSTLTGVAEITLMEAEYLSSLDQEIGTAYFNVWGQIRELDQWQSEIFNFSGELGVRGCCCCCWWWWWWWWWWR